MKSMIIKTIMGMTYIRVTIGDPHEFPGANSDGSLEVREINNIPNDVSSDLVLSKFKDTIDATLYSETGERLSFDYDELGHGKIIAS